MGIAEEPTASPEPLLARLREGESSGTAPGELSRRHLLRAAALAGAGVPLLAACASSSSGARTDSTTSAGGGGGTATHGGKKQHTSTGDPSSGGSGGAGSALATTSQVPKGGGIILADAGVVITQPSAGTFEGFSSTCTHMGCTLDNVSNGTINCICHGSQFSIKNGKVVTGPATVPLPAMPLVVKGKDISLK
jgi:Rieske Fe-S protein